MLVKLRGKMKTKEKVKQKREYIILAYEPKTMEWLKKRGYNLSELYFIRVKEYSKLGKLIKKEAKRRLKL